MSVINQVLRDLDARGAALGPERYNPWSPDAGRQAQEARFFAYPTAPAPRAQHDALWRRPVTALLMALLLVMLLGAPWLSQVIERVRTPDAEPLARSAQPARKPATVSDPLTAAASPFAPGPLSRTQPASAAPRRAGTPSTDNATRPKLASTTRPIQTAASPALSVEDLAPPAAGRAPLEPRQRPSVATDTAARLAAPPSGVTPAPDLGPSSPALALPTPVATVEKKVTPLNPPQRAQSSYAQAVESTQSGRSMLALTQAQEALRHQPGHQLARHLAAVLLHETARTDQAVELLREGLNLDPRADKLSLLLARLQAHQGTLDAALQTLDQHQLHTLEAETLRGGLWSQLRQYKQAASAYEAAVQKQPGQVTLWLGWGVALEGDGQGSAARQAFARAQAMGLPDPELSAFVAQRLKALE